MSQKRLAPTRNVFAPFKDWPIAAKLLLLVLAPLFLILATTLFLAITGLNRLETETSTEQLQQEARVISQQFAHIQEDLLLNANQLTANPVVLNAIQAGDAQTLKGFLLSFSLRSVFSHVQVIDGAGQTIFVNQSTNLGQTPQLERLHNLGLLDVTDATDLIPTPAGWLLVTVRSIKLPSGEIIGALSIGRLLDNVTLAALNFERTNPSLVVFDTEGQVINASEVEQGAEAEVEPDLTQTYELDRNLWAEASTGATLLGQGQVRGEPERVAYVPLVIKDEVKAVFGVVLSSAQASALRNQLILTNIGAAGVLGLLTILAALSLGRRYITRPITALASGAEQMAAGQMEVALPNLTSRDELGRLTLAFNDMTGRLQQTLLGLEDRSQRLEIITNISEHLAALLDLPTLLVEVVNQIKDNFAYYHVHIYLFDAQKEKLVVTAGTGVAGAEMKAKGHAILLNAPRSLVARAARSSETVRVDNVREAEDWLPNPLLPDTYSEMAVPIILEGEVVGVLDVQQDKIAALDEDDAYLLRTLANQVAVAIGNARQFAQVQAALAEARAAQQQYIAQGWDKSRVTKKNVGRVQYSLSESGSLEENLIAAGRQQALKQSGPTMVALTGNQSDADGSAGPQALVAPIMLRNVPIGDLQLHDDPARAWNEADLALVNAVVDQVAQAAENLRLVSETQDRAGREQLINQVSEKLRRAPDMETLLQTGVSELARILGPARTFAHLNMNVGQPSQKGNGVNDTVQSSVSPL